MTTDTLAKLAAKAAHEAVSAIYFADSSDYLPALRSITRLLAPDLAAMLDTDEQLAWQTSDDRANGPDEIAAQALPAAEPVYQCQLANLSWIDQSKHSYNYNVKHGAATVRVLYTTPQAAQQAAQPEFIPIAIRKLAELQDQGYLINGYSLIHKEKLARGLIDSYGFVGWWNNRDHEQAATPKAALVAEFGERMAGYGEGFDDGKGVGERQAAQAPVGWEWPDVLLEKMERFWECADDGQGCDIGRDWLDALTLIGLLRRAQRSPAMWEMTAAGRALVPAALPQPQPQSAQAKGDAL